MVGVMNADPKYHLQGLPALGEVLALRGDAPSAIQMQLENARRVERESSQDIGLHLLGILYGKLEEQTQGADAKKAVGRLAYQRGIARAPVTRWTFTRVAKPASIRPAMASPTKTQTSWLS
jgi:hypothetical protein